MFRILCYGDSNTWGYNPASGLRFPEKNRWPGVLRQELGSGFEIIEDGKNGRRVLTDISEFYYSIESSGQLDVVIIYLGINDICFDREVRVADILEGFSVMLKGLTERYNNDGSPAPEVIIIGAVPINDVQVQDCLYAIEAEKAEEYSAGLRRLAGKRGCGYIEPNRIIESSPLDGIHLEAEAHRKLGLFIADYTRNFLKNGNLNSRKS